MASPYWSGQIQISLVSFGVKLFPAVEVKSEIRFHQISRKTGERIHHRKVAGDSDAEASPVEKDEIVKGYEYRKGEYIMIEPSEIENLRIPSRHTLAISQFVDLEELSLELFEKPYFVVPEADNQAEAYTVIREALQVTHKAALGKIAVGGRERLVAISASSDSDSEGPRGMMAYLLRYPEELRSSASYFSEIKKVAVDADQLSLAKELIQRKASRFAPEKFHDEYEAALREMVEAKVKHAPLPKDEPAPRSAKVINLMDALRKSMGTGMAEEQGKARADGRTKKPAKPIEMKKGPTSVKLAAGSKSTTHARRSA